MKTKSKRLLSSILATILLGQNLLCNNALITNLKVNATSTDKETLVQEIEERAESLKYSGSRSSGISLFSLFSTKKSNSADSLNISGYVSLEDSRTSDVTILIFDDNWNTLAQTTADFNNNGYFNVSAPNIKGRTSTTHIKIECDGYLPRFYKDMGFGSYQLGTESNPEILYFGDTTYNPAADNQWSDEVINQDDLTFVTDQLGKIKGDENFDDRYDLNHDGLINNDDISIIADYDGYNYDESTGNLYINSEQSEWYSIYTVPDYVESILKYDLDDNNVIDSNDQQVICDLYPYGAVKGDEDFPKIDYMDIDGNGTIDDNDYRYFEYYINNHNGHNPYNDYIYNLTLTGNSYHEGAMYLENTNLDLASYNLVVNGNLVFRTQNPYNSVLWGDNPGVILNVANGALSIAGQFDFGQANSYDQIIMQEDAGELYIWENWNYITLADMEGKWIAGRIGLFGNTWQVNEQSGEKAVFSSGTHSILFGGYEYGQQVIRWDNRYDTIYNEFTGERNTPRQLNLDYTQGDLCLGVLLSKEYTSENYYFRPSLPDLVTLYQDADNNGINDSIDEVYGGDEVNEEKLEENEDIVQKWINKRIIETPEDEVIEELYSEDNPYKKDNLKALGKYLYDKARAEIEGVENFATKTYSKVKETLLTLSDEIPDCVKLGYDGFRFAISLSPDPICQSIDFVLSVADVGYDLLTFECTTAWFADFGLDVIGVIPFIGAAKEFTKTSKVAKELVNLDEVKKVDGLLGWISQKGITKTAKDLAEKYGKKALNQLGEEIKKEATKKFFEEIDELAPKINELLSDKSEESFSKRINDLTDSIKETSGSAKKKENFTENPEDEIEESTTNLHPHNINTTPENINTDRTVDAIKIYNQNEENFRTLESLEPEEQKFTLDIIYELPERTIDKVFEIINQSDSEDFSDTAEQIIDFAQEVLQNKAERPSTLAHFDEAQYKYLEDLKNPNSNIWENIDNPSQYVQKLIDNETSIKQVLNNLIDNGKFCMSVDNNTLELILNSDGKFKSQIETGTSNGTEDIESRKDACSKLFGADIDEVKDNEFEKYGALLTSTDIKECFKEGILSQYGNLIVEFKKDNLYDKTTLTIGDSFEGLYYSIFATKVNNPQISAVPIDQIDRIIENIDGLDGNQITSTFQLIANAFLSYIELQYHGNLTIDDIEKVYYTDEKDIQNIKGLLEAKNISVEKIIIEK